MFDPDAYFASLERVIKGCKGWADTDGPFPAISYDSYGNWSWCTWRFEAVFPDGCKLQAFESHSIRKGRHLRHIRYRLTKADGEMIVQVDPHAGQVPYEKSPHIHIGPEQQNRVYDGDPQLNGYSLKDYDFLKIWALVDKYINGGGLPWQA